jgi:hypothetical protein
MSLSLASLVGDWISRNRGTSLVLEGSYIVRQFGRLRNSSPDSATGHGKGSYIISCILGDAFEHILGTYIRVWDGHNLDFHNIASHLHTSYVATLSCCVVHATVLVMLSKLISHSELHSFPAVFSKIFIRFRVLFVNHLPNNRCGVDIGIHRRLPLRESTMQEA